MGLWGNQMGVGGWVAMIALWVALLAVVVWAVCRMFPIPHHRAERGLDPHALLNTCAASGEAVPEINRSLRSQPAATSPLADPEPATTKGPR